MQDICSGALEQGLRACHFHLALLQAWLMGWMMESDTSHLFRSHLCCFSLLCLDLCLCSSWWDQQNLTVKVMFMITEIVMLLTKYMAGLMGVLSCELAVFQHYGQLSQWKQTQLKQKTEDMLEIRATIKLFRNVVCVNNASWQPHLFNIQKQHFKN